MTEQKPYAKRQAVALAVAAALLAASGAAAADQVNYDRITESIDSPTTDAVVTYTDQTADTFVTQPPVMPEDRDAQATGMTLTLNSLTVTNETTEGYSTSGSRNGLGITTNGGFVGTSAWKDPSTGGVHLAITGDVSVTARGNALQVSNNNNIDGTIGGNLTVKTTPGGGGVGLYASAGEHDATIDRGILLTLNGGEASITTDGFGIETDSSSATVKIEGASKTTISSTYVAIANYAGEVDIFGSGKGGAGGSVVVESTGVGTPYAVMSMGSGMVALQAGSVKVQNLNQTSDAVAAIGGNVVLTSLDANGTGVQVYSNAPASDNLNAQVPTIYAGQKGGVTIQAQNSPIEVLNQAGGQVITTSGESSVAINPSQMATGVRVNGNVTNDDKSSVGIYETGTGSYLKADKITTTASSSTYVVLHGDAAYTSLSGGTSEAMVDGQESYLVIQGADTGKALANVTTTQGALSGLSFAGNSTLTGNLNSFGIAPGYESKDDDMTRSCITLSLYENSAYKGTSTVTDGGHIYGTFSGAATMEGDVNVSGRSSGDIPSTWNFNGSGTGSFTGNMSLSDGAMAELWVTDTVKADGDFTAKDDKTLLYLMGSGESVLTGNVDASAGATAAVYLGDTAILNGDVTATGTSTKVTEVFYPGTTVNGDLTSSDSAAVTTQLGGTWNGTSTISGGTTDLEFTDASAVWNIAANSEVTSLKQSSGTINFPAAPSTGFTGTTLTIDGDYSADGGTVNMSTVLQGDTSPHDKIVVNGNTSGTANLVFTKVSGYGSQTIEGIKVVQVAGTSDAVFTKPDSNRLTAGAYIYDLKKVGNDWYLTSERDPNAKTVMLPHTYSNTTDNPSVTPTDDLSNNSASGDDVLPDVLPATDPTDPTTHIVKPELGSYAANLYGSNTLFTMSLYDRLGETRYSDALKSQKKSGNVWIRMQGGKNHTNMYDDQLTNRGTYGIVQVGGDLVTWPGSGDHRFHVGLMGGYAHQSTKTRSSDIGLTSKGKLSGYSAGFYATYMNDKPEATGPYADLWMIYQHFTDKVHASSAAEEEYHSKGWTGSLEAGYTFGLKDWVSASGTQNATRLQLQAQVIRMGVRADEHVDAENFTVQGTGAGNVRTRIGATAYHLFTNPKTGRAIKPYLTLNWYHDTKNFGVVYDGVKDRIEGTRNFGEVKFGIEGKVSKNVNLWGAALYQAGSHSYWNAGAFVGAKILF